MIERLEVLRFPLIYAVVVIHTAHSSMLTMGPAALYIREYISWGVANLAVPVFFLVAGYLYFSDWQPGMYVRKLLTRGRSLLVPYVLWNFIAFGYMVAFFASPSPNTSHFWFLQELMLMVVIAPVFHLLHRNVLSGLGLMLIVYLLLDWKKDWPVASSMMPFLFFYAGSVVALRKQSLFMCDKYGYVLMMVSLIFFSVDNLIHPSGYLIYKFGILLGVPGVLFLSKFLPRKPFMWLGGASFFVYAFHQPILGQMISRVFVWFDIRTDAQILVAYFIIPAVTCAVGVVLYWLLKRYTPGFTSLLTGGR